MAGNEKIEDMIEIENIKPEPQIKEEVDLSCDENFDYFSNDDFSNNDRSETHALQNIKTEEIKLSVNNQDQNVNDEQSFLLLKKNPFCDIQISDISYTSNNEFDQPALQLNRVELIDSFPGNEIEKIVFQCEVCNEPIKSRVDVDHSYTKQCNRLKQIVETEERKAVIDQIYKCKLCLLVLSSPNNYLLHLQTHGSEVISCQSCCTQFKMFDSLNAHFLVRTRFCEICRKVFTHDRGYKQHLLSHEKSNDVKIIEIETPKTIKEIHQSNENEESVSVFVQETKINIKNEEISQAEEDNESFNEANKKFFSNHMENARNLGSKSELIMDNKTNETSKPTTSSKREQKIHKAEIVKVESLSNRSQEPILIDDSMENLTPSYEFEKIIFLFECTGCARNFVSKKAILEHVTEKHTEEYKMWDSLYKIKKLIDRKSTQTSEDKYTCRFCPVKFNSISIYMSHLKIHHVCNHCDKIFDNQQILDDHKRQLQESLICRICKIPFLVRSNFLAHLKSHDNDCEICQEQFNSEAMLLVHRKVSHPEGICYICHKWFSSKEILKRHKTQVHNNSVKTFSCWLCSKRFRSEVTFRSHMSSHGEKRPFSCPHCGKFYARYTAMVAHSEKCELFDERKIFECEICKLAFYESKQFVSHMKEHFEVQRERSNNVDNLKDQENVQNDKDISAEGLEKAEVLQYTKHLKNTSDLKNRVNLKKVEASPKLAFNSNNLKLLPFGPKIVWRESSFPKLPENKIERERQRKHERKQQSEKLKSYMKKSLSVKRKSMVASTINSRADALLANNSEIISNMIEQPNTETKPVKETNKIKTYSRTSSKLQSFETCKKEFMKQHDIFEELKDESSNCQLLEEEDPLKITDDEKSLFVTQIKPGGQTFQEKSPGKFLVLKRIAKGTLERSMKNIKIAKLIFPTSNTETEFVDPLTMEYENNCVSKIVNSSPINGTYKPSTLKYVAMDSAKQMETVPSLICNFNPLTLKIERTMKTSTVTCESDPLALENSSKVS